MDAIYQPKLGLRGGGADWKRKEARKRKFAQADDEEHQLSRHAVFEDNGASTKQKLGKGSRSNSMSDQKRETVQANDLRHDEYAVEHNGTRVSAIPVKEGQELDEAEGMLSQMQNKPRFIVFIGNLPYTSTTESLSKHFAKVQPISIRHRTNRGSGTSKGFAFLEFAAYDRMKTCLKLYHHSMLDDGQSPARKINVELTVGGGGARSTMRKSKLKAKNWKLAEERRRKAEGASEVERDKASNKGASGDQEKGEGEGPINIRRTADNEGDIHPSRRSMLSIRGSQKH